jgi:acetyl esterase/lipase
MRTILVLLFAVLMVTAMNAVESPIRIALWDGQAPVGDGGIDSEDAYLFVHRPVQPDGRAVVICPGGGYGMLCMDPEGHGIAKWLNAQGITGIVLQYRLPKGRHQVPLLDAQRAMRYVRQHATEWELDPTRIGIMGFSAGGHLASTLATHFDAGVANAADAIAQVSCRPDFAILIYPVISTGEQGHRGSIANLLGSNPPPELLSLYSNEGQVTGDTPPCFLAHAKDDSVVPIENSRLFAAACEDKSVSVRLLELPNGNHGLNGYKGPSWDAWQAGSLAWLAEVLPKPTE